MKVWKQFKNDIIIVREIDEEDFEGTFLIVKVGNPRGKFFLLNKKKKLTLINYEDISFLKGKVIKEKDWSEEIKGVVLKILLIT